MSIIDNDNRSLLLSTGPPSMPSEVPYVSDLLPDSLMLSWRSVELPSRITDYSPCTYRIEALDGPAGEWRVLVRGVHRTQHHVTGLRPETEYRFRVRAENKYGLSGPTESVLVQKRAGRVFSDFFFYVFIVCVFL